MRTNGKYYNENERKNKSDHVVPMQNEKPSSPNINIMPLPRDLVSNSYQETPLKFVPKKNRSMNNPLFLVMFIYDMVHYYTQHQQFKSDTRHNSSDEFSRVCMIIGYGHEKKMQPHDSTLMVENQYFPHEQH